MDLPGSWTGGAQYDAYAGRWSRRLAPRFRCWLTPQPGLRWLDVGCGTGALSGKSCSRPRSPPFVASTPRRQLWSTPLTPFPTRGRPFGVSSAQALPVDDGSVDAVVSGLVLDFVPDPAAARRDAARNPAW